LIHINELTPITRSIVQSQQSKGGYHASSASSAETPLVPFRAHSGVV
jgi:hypothetical protein